MRQMKWRARKDRKGPDSERTIVIGSEVAAARMADTEHQATGSGSPSPLAAIEYNADVGDFDLRHMTDSPVDGAVEALVEEFTTVSVEGRDSLRASLTMNDFYTLMMYARRMAVRALRNRSPIPARLAATSLAMIEQRRVDWRDLSWAAALVSYAATTVSADAQRLLREAASIAEPEAREVLLRFADSPALNLSEWGFRVYDTDDGPGLLGDEGAPYAPSIDLVAVADRTQQALAETGWTIAGPTIGSTLPSVWLRAGTEAPDGAFGSITGCLSLRGRAVGDSQDAKAQLMLIFIAETSTPEAALTIAQAAGPGPGSAFVGFGVAASRICAVLIAESYIRGVAAIETQESIERYRSPLLAALTSQDS